MGEHPSLTWVCDGGCKSVIVRERDGRLEDDTWQSVPPGTYGNRKLLTFCPECYAELKEGMDRLLGVSE